MPRRASLPVSNALRKTHSYLRLRHSRSMKTLSIQRPRPSIEMRMPAPFSVVVKAKLVNCEHWSVLKMSGLPCRAIASSRAADAEVGIHGVRQPPGQNLATEPVHDSDEVEEAAPHRKWSKKRCCASPPRTVRAPFSAYGSLFNL